MAESSARRSRRRSAGEGSVYEAGGRWRGAITWTDPAGIQRRRYVSAPTSAEARAKVDELRRDLRLGMIAASSRTETVASFLEDWLTRYRPTVRPSTWRKTEMHVRVYLVPALGRLPLATLSAKDVERAMASFERDGRPERPTQRTRGRQNASGVSRQTVRHIRSTLRRALADAVRDGRAIRNAAADAHPPRLEHRAIVYLAARDITRFLDATEDDELGPLYALAATTGLRLGELLALTWADVEGGQLRVRRSMAATFAGGYELAETKTARSRRTLPLPVRARQALEVRRTRQLFARNAAGDAWQDRDGLVFTDSIGRPLRPGAVSWAFGKARDAAGIPRVRFHDLRHSAATALLAAGVPLAVISEWLGHSGISITAQAYAAVVPELLTEAAAAMDRALDGSA